MKICCCFGSAREQRSQQGNLGKKKDAAATLGKDTLGSTDGANTYSTVPTNGDARDGQPSVSPSPQPPPPHATGLASPQSPNPIDMLPGACSPLTPSDYLDCTSLSHALAASMTQKGVSLGETVVRTAETEGVAVVLEEDQGKFRVQQADGSCKWVQSVELADIQDLLPASANPSPPEEAHDVTLKQGCLVPLVAGARRKSVTLRISETATAVPGDYHKAPVGAGVVVLTNGEWTPGVVKHLNPDGTCDVAWGSGVVQYRVRPEHIAHPSEESAGFARTTLQGRWYDGLGHRWDVVHLSLLCRVAGSGAMLVQHLEERGAGGGMIFHNGVRLEKITPDLAQWADGGVWRRVQGRNVECPISDSTVQWCESVHGLTVLTASVSPREGGVSSLPAGTVRKNDILHSVDGVSVFTLEDFTSYVFMTHNPVLKLLLLPPTPHIPEPCRPFDLHSASVGDRVEALWGGRYHPCTILAKVTGGPVVIRWAFDLSNWATHPIALRRPEPEEEEDSHPAERVAHCWKRAKRLFNTLLEASGGALSEEHLIRFRSIARADLMAALRLSRLSAKSQLRLLQSGGAEEQVTLTDWLVWIGRLAEMGLAEGRLDWVESLVSPQAGLSPPPPPPADLPSITSQPRRSSTAVSCNSAGLAPPIVECALVEPGRGKVIGECGSVARRGEAFETERVGTLPQGALIDVVEVQGRRARMAAPMRGWVSLTTADGDTLIAEGPPACTPNSATLLRLPEESLGCTFHGCVLTHVDAVGPGARARLQRFVGRMIIRANGKRVYSDRAIHEMALGPTTTQVTLAFKPLKTVEAELRKRPGEQTGAVVDAEGTLVDVLDSSPAQRSGFGSHVGKTLVSLNGQPIARAGSIELLCTGASSATFTFKEGEPGSVHEVADRVEELVGTPPTTPQQPAGLMERADSEPDNTPAHTFSVDPASVVLKDKVGHNGHNDNSRRPKESISTTSPPRPHSSRPF